MPRRKKEEQPQEEIKKIKTPKLVEGMKDILPGDEKYWNFMEEKMRRIIRDYSFRKVYTPVIEKYELFNHTLFKQTGMMEKESFSFIDKGQKVVLRPEMTSSIARSFISHNMQNQIPPLKMYSWGPVFRQGKVIPNKNLRQFNQITFEIYGEKAPAIDAELIIIAYYMLKNCGLDVQVKLNSLGCVVCRLEYSKALSGFLKSKRAAVCVDCRKKVTRDPLKFLTCDNAKCKTLREDAPQTVDYLCDECRNHLFRVLEYLDELKIPYQLDSGLLRGFDYYNKSAFEITTMGNEEHEPNVLAAGGRYDYLVEMLGGPNTPAAGFSMGLERVINQIKTDKVELPEEESPDVFVCQLSEQARQKAFGFFEQLRAENYSVRANFSQSSLKAQMEQANKLGAKIILILGQKEVNEGTVIIREVASGIQEVISASKVSLEVKKRLKAVKKAKK